MSISSLSGYNNQLNFSTSNVNKGEKEQASEQPQTVSPDQQRKNQTNSSPSLSPAVKVTISEDALLALSKVNQSSNIVPSQYEQFFPAREGYSVSNLVAGVEDPSAQPFSQNRPFAEVTKAARESLDSKYQQMEDSGKPYDRSSVEGVDDSALFGELDRRALHAVASNEGGLFTEKEQRTAKMLMGQQQALAMGLYRGPIRLAGEYSHPNKQGGPQMSLSAIKYLDQVSNEEKSSVAWAHSRAVSQFSYEIEMSDRGLPAGDFTSENPLVQLIKAALDTWPDRPGVMGGGKVENEDDLREQPWFHGFEDRLEGAIAKTQELYGV